MSNDTQSKISSKRDNDSPFLVNQIKKHGNINSQCFFPSIDVIPADQINQDIKKLGQEDINQRTKNFIAFSKFFDKELNKKKCEMDKSKNKSPRKGHNPFERQGSKRLTQLKNGASELFSNIFRS